MKTMKRPVEDSKNEIGDIIGGNAKCASAGVIFACGISDPGNIRVCVGSQFLSSILSKFPSVAV